ncbi:hypothetical protein GCM10008174_15310 [Methylopila turkensis]|uniref:Uncharacterized protein n=3 Tax=Methylopila TaxID=61653 RepID=A0A9W6JPU0_9HYPH|nr:hypothetical protein GCM10008174_15310 [Methylopila turkensis]
MFETMWKLAMLTIECQQVIGLRMAMVARGGAEVGEEIQLMMSEKTASAFRCGPALLAGGSFDRMIDDYRGVVQANALRLAAPVAS